MRMSINFSASLKSSPARTATLRIQKHKPQPGVVRGDVRTKQPELAAVCVPHLVVPSPTSSSWVFEISIRTFAAALSTAMDCRMVAPSLVTLIDCEGEPICNKGWAGGTNKQLEVSTGLPHASKALFNVAKLMLCVHTYRLKDFVHALGAKGGLDKVCDCNSAHESTHTSTLTLVHLRLGIQNGLVSKTNSMGSVRDGSFVWCWWTAAALTCAMMTTNRKRKSQFL